MARLACLLALLVVVIPDAGLAQDRLVEVVMPANSHGMAWAGRTLGKDGSPVILNPAALGVDPMLMTGLSGGPGGAGISAVYSGQNSLGLSGGLAYNFVDEAYYGSKHFLHLSGAWSVSLDPVQLHLGVGIKSADTMAADLGLVLEVGDMFKVAAVGYNLVRGGDEVNRGPSLAGGLSFHYGPVLLAFDVGYRWEGAMGREDSESDLYIMTGAQVRVCDWILLRAGMSRGGQFTANYSGGASFTWSDWLAVDAGLVTHGSELQAKGAEFGVRVFWDSLLIP